MTTAQQVILTVFVLFLTEACTTTESIAVKLYHKTEAAIPW